MMGPLVALDEDDYAAIHHMMLLQGFPAVPVCFAEAEPYLAEVELFGLKRNGCLIAVFLFGERTAESAYLDVLCAPGWQGKWARPAVLRALGRLAFCSWKLRFLWAHSYGSTALLAALRGGFVPIAPLTGTDGVLVLTRQAYFNKYEKGTGDGISL